jgi:hypothetical protein
MGLVIAALAFAVFAWGTSYKLSLYHHEYSGRTMPEAKLCTRASDAAKLNVAAVVKKAHSETPSLLPFLYLLSLSNPHADRPVPQGTYSNAPPVFSSGNTGFSPHLFFRPPPFLS